MMSFIHSGSGIRTFRVSSGNKLDVAYLAMWQHKSLKYALLTFDGDMQDVLGSILMDLQIASTYIYNGYQNWTLFSGFGVTEKQCFGSFDRGNITR